MHVCVEKGMRRSEGENGISGPLLVQRAITCGAQLSTSFRRIDFPSSERGASMSSCGLAKKVARCLLSTP